jgi:hypothetical protein
MLTLCMTLNKFIRQKWHLCVIVRNIIIRNEIFHPFPLVVCMSSSSPRNYLMTFTLSITTAATVSGMLSTEFVTSLFLWSSTPCSTISSCTLVNVIGTISHINVFRATWTTSFLNFMFHPFQHPISPYIPLEHNEYVTLL